MQRSPQEDPLYDTLPDCPAVKRACTASRKAGHRTASGLLAGPSPCAACCHPDPARGGLPIANRLPPERAVRVTRHRIRLSRGRTQRCSRPRSRDHRRGQRTCWLEPLLLTRELPFVARQWPRSGVRPPSPMTRPAPKNRVNDGHVNVPSYVPPAFRAHELSSQNNG